MSARASFISIVAISGSNAGVGPSVRGAPCGLQTSSGKTSSRSCGVGDLRHHPPPGYDRHDVALDGRVTSDSASPSKLRPIKNEHDAGSLCDAGVPLRPLVRTTYLHSFG